MKRSIGVVFALLLLLLPAVATGAYDPVGGGLAKLRLDKRFVTFLARDKVKLIPAAPATRRGRAFLLPAIGGSIDPTIQKGEVELEGALIVRNARKRIPIRRLVVKTTHAPLVAKVGGSQLKLFETSKLSSVRQRFGFEFTAERLKLTSRLATRLDKKLRPPVPFEAGQPIGTLVALPQPLVTTIVPGGRASLVLDSAFVSKLNELFVSVNPIFPAEHVGPDFTLPIIASGALSPDGTTGVLRTGGDIEFLKLGFGQIFWHELWFDLGTRSTLAEVDLEPSPPFAGKLGQVPNLTIDQSSTSANGTARTIALGPTLVRLTASTADSFNHAFAEGNGVFQPGEAFAILAFTAESQ
jgi:hypothetical protein